MTAPRRRRFGHLLLEWDHGELVADPFAPIVPLEMEASAGTLAGEPDITLQAHAVSRPTPDPGQHGAATVLYHGNTQCFLRDGELLLWDRASTLRIGAGGRRIHAEVHDASLEQLFHFSSVTVMMSLLLALRSHGLYHLHAAAARWPDGESWLVPGESSSGKSTLATALFASGAQWLSDDALLLRARDPGGSVGLGGCVGTGGNHGAGGSDGEGGVEALGWARPIRMTPRTAAAFPELRPLLQRCAAGSDRDYEVDPRRAFPGRGLATTTAPFALLFPRIAGGSETRVQELERAEALGRLLHACAWVASSHLPDRQDQLALLGRLVDSARSYDVAVGDRVLSDPGAVVDQIRSHLARH